MGVGAADYRSVLAEVLRWAAWATWRPFSRTSVRRPSARRSRP